MVTPSTFSARTCTQAGMHVHTHTHMQVHVHMHTHSHMHATTQFLRPTTTRVAAPYRRVAGLLEECHERHGSARAARQEEVGVDLLGARAGVGVVRGTEDRVYVGGARFQGCVGGNRARLGTLPW